MNNFIPGIINDIVVKDLTTNKDSRGWLIELFRKDTTSDDILPEMCYVSLTRPGVVRGPHEHIEQTDYFCFVGPSDFKLVLWDNRKNSTTYRNKMILSIGENNPKVVIVPPGIVHAYKNVGNRAGLVINLPNRLYAGWKKKEKVDEIRYENDQDSHFKVD